MSATARRQVCGSSLQWPQAVSAPCWDSEATNLSLLLGSGDLTAFDTLFSSGGHHGPGRKAWGSVVSVFQVEKASSHL